MLEMILLGLVIGLVLFEFIEHVIFPLAWLILKRKKISPCDVRSMVGKEAEVREWQGNHGKVTINGELWNATSETVLHPGAKAVIEGVEGLVLKVKSTGK